MRFIPNYRVIYGGLAHEAGREFSIDAKDADEMKRHGTVLDEPTPPRKPGRPARKKEGSENGQHSKAPTENG